MTNEIALYASEAISPFVLRVEIALQEVGVDAVQHEVDLWDAKPAWYAERINPTGKIPAITYGPPHPIDQPAPSSVKVNESLIIVKFIADLYPQANNNQILPANPVKRAKARVFAALIDSVLLPALRRTMYVGSEGIPELHKAWDVVQAQLPPPDSSDIDGTANSYAVGNEFTIADIAAAPLFGILEVILSNDIGMYGPGEGLEAFEVYKGAKYDRLREYARRILARKSCVRCIRPDVIKENVSKSLPRRA